MKTDFERHQDGALTDDALEFACGGDLFDGARDVVKTVKEILDHLTDPFRKGKDTN